MTGPLRTISTHSSEASNASLRGCKDAVILSLGLRLGECIMRDAGLLGDGRWTLRVLEDCSRITSWLR